MASRTRTATPAATTTAASSDNFWDVEELLAAIPKNKSAQYQVHYHVKDGSEYLSLREWYEKADGEWAPTRKGLAVPLDRAQAVVEALSAALEAVVRQHPAGAK